MSFNKKNASVRLLLLGLFCCVHFLAKATVQDPPCALLISPVQGEVDVPVTATISFNTVPGAVNYFVDLGTTPAGTNILNNFSVNASGSFVPPQGMPELTLVYITIRAFFVSGPPLQCATQSFTTEDVVTVPSCTRVTLPTGGQTDISVSTNISWDYAPRATGYFVSLGTTPGGTDVLNTINAGNSLLFNIPFDLDPLTTYYITITPYNENGEALGCTGSSFTTEFVDIFPPICTQLITPADGAIEVALTPILAWSPVPTADGYFISVGSTPNGTDVLDNTDIGNQTSTAVIDFDEGTTYYATITPYNIAGQALGCAETSFTTTFGCGPYTDEITGELIDLNPIINIEESYQLCQEDAPLLLSYNEPAYAVTWYTMGAFDEVVYATGNSVNIEDGGIYRLEVVTEETVEAGTILCTASQSFEVTVSETPTIENISFTSQGLTASVTVIVSGDGDYEYANGSVNGPYQSSPILNQVPFSNIDIYVRDRNGCGVANQMIRPDLGFPKYFTPNSDGINDYWQVRGVIVDGETIIQIEIFNRFGKRITTISPYGQGWDGTYAGKTLFDQGFWYKASTASARVFTGHFALRK